MAVAETSSAQRLHHLDALRAFAMLLGIALHSAVAYAETYGWVVDPQRVPALRHLLMAVHGFRMQLLFLLAGYVTARLARRSSPPEVLRQRTRRVLLPLVLASLTLLPLLRCVQRQAEGPFLLQTAPTAQLDDDEAAAVSGDDRAIDQRLDQTTQERRAHLLTLAAAAGRESVIAQLLHAGVDVDARTTDGSTALQAAAMYGQRSTVERLLEAGADVTAVDGTGRGVLDALQRDRTATVTIAMERGQPVDWAAVRAGREQVRAFLAARGVPVDRTASKAAEAAPSLLRTPILEHLWFLWFLWLYIVGYAAVCRFATRLPAVPLTGRSRFALVTLATTMGLIAAMFPDRVWDLGAPTTLSLLPDLTVLAYYGLFFAVGAVLSGRADGMTALARGWQPALLLAPLAYAAAQGFVAQEAWTHRIAPDATAWRIASLLLPALFAWLMIIGLTGAFARALPRPNTTIRYLSDAARAGLPARAARGGDAGHGQVRAGRLRQRDAAAHQLPVARAADVAGPAAQRLNRIPDTVTLSVAPPTGGSVVRAPAPTARRRTRCAPSAPHRGRTRPQPAHRAAAARARRCRCSARRVRCPAPSTPRDRCPAAAPGASADGPPSPAACRRVHHDGDGSGASGSGSC